NFARLCARPPAVAPGRFRLQDRAAANSPSRKRLAGIAVPRHHSLTRSRAAELSPVWSQSSFGMGAGATLGHMSNPTFFLSREAQQLGTDRELRRRHARGEMVRLRAGVFMGADAWANLDRDERYRAHVRAAALVSPAEAQFSHASAAALWRLPSLRRWPAAAHQLVERSAGGTSRVGIIRRGLGTDPRAVRLDGVLTTSLPRTLLDIASANDFASGVVAMDAGRREPEPEDFRFGLFDAAPTLDELDLLFRGLSPYPAPARVCRVMEFSTPLS